MRNLCACLLVVPLLAGCQYLTDPIPTCADNATLDGVREIIGKHILGEGSAAPSIDLLRERLTFNYPHATKLEENIERYSCAAVLSISGGSQKHEIQITYDSQLDDSGNHLIDVTGINVLEAAVIKDAFSLPDPQRALPAQGR